MAEHNPLISIIMPVKNAGPWLSDCLESISAQTYNYWELIAVDDHSTDNSFQFINEFSKKDGRVKPLASSGAGIIDALNTALQHSSGALITRMDADDLMPIQKLGWFVSAHLQAPMNIVTGKVKYFSDKPISPGYLDYENWLNDRIDKQDHWKWSYRECVIASGNWMAPKSMVHFELDTYPEDYNCVLGWYRQDFPITSINEITHLWREHPMRTSRKSKHYQQQAFFDLKLDHFLKHRRAPSRPLMVMGKNKKAKLIRRHLKSKGQEYIQVDLEHLYRFAEVEDPQVLVAVFPDVTVRDGISDYLGGFGLELGTDWWWV